MKYLFLLLTSFQAAASTTIIFSKDGQRATVSMTSMSNNPDAIRLFEALAQAPQNFGGRSSKRLSFTDINGIKALDINCLVSDAYKELGNCVVTFYKSVHVKFSPATNQVQMLVIGQDGPRLAQEFHITVPEIYQSDDRKLQILAKPEAGIGAVEVKYN